MIIHEYHIIVYGQVQGVSFRSKTKQHADRMGLKGTVSNRKDGNVAICLTGTNEEVNRLISNMQAEPLPIQITRVEITKVPCHHAYSDFSIVDSKRLSP